jgi:hypothetical protein
MVGFVRAVLRATALALAVLAVVLTQTALAEGPTNNQIRQAAAEAQGSGDTWATINVCQSWGIYKGGQLGIRGQMPALGLDAQLRMTIHLAYWSQLHERYEPIPGPSGTSNITLGTFSSGVQQAGMLYNFAGSGGRLAASVDFLWVRDGRVIAQTTRFVSAGHPDADYGQPANLSAAQCTLGS